MSHIDGTMEFKLLKPVKYSKAGEFVETDLLVFQEFDSSHTRQYMKLKKIIDKAVFDARQMADDRDKEQIEQNIAGSKVEKFHEKSEESHAEEAEGIAELLNVGMSISNDDDIFGKFVNIFKEMLFKGNPICMVNGETRMGDAVWTEMHPQDKIDAALRYCAFFGIGLLGKLKEESEIVSEQPTQVKEL